MASMRMDYALHFKNKVVLSLLDANGIEARWSIPYMPIANGVAERAVGEAKRAGDRFI